MVDSEKSGLALWPTKILGPRPGLKEMNVACWGMFVTFLFVPICIVLFIQLKTGRLFFEQSEVDFIYFYGTGQIANQHPAIQVYDYNLQMQVFNHIFQLHEGTYGPSPYPPFVSQFFRPFARLTFEQAYFSWMGISLALYITGIALTLKEFLRGEPLKRSLVFCFALASYPFLMNTLANGQLSSVAVCSVGVALTQEKRSRPFLCGLALSILCYKPTLLLILVPMLLLTRRFRTLLGFGTGVGILAAVSTALAGFQIWPAYFRFITRFGHTSGLYGKTSLRLWKYADLNSFSYAVPGGRTTIGLGIMLCAIAVVSVWLAWLLWNSASGDANERALAWATALTWTLLVNIYVPIYDTILLVLAVILTLSALENLKWKSALEWFTAIAVFNFAVAWITEGVQKRYGIQPLTLTIAVAGLAQNWFLHRATQARKSKSRAEVLAT